jgi:GntR family transcriptional regulator / MocR family aminotransferase
MKKPGGAPLALFAELDGDAAMPLHRRAYYRVREMILRGALAPGSRLPSTRSLAADIAVSRNTVEVAFSQLEAEGYITRRVGAGSFVASTLPEPRRGRTEQPPRAESKGRERAKRLARAVGHEALSTRGRTMAVAGPNADVDADATFGVCRPALDAFPTGLWNRVAARRGRRLGERLLDECSPTGLEELRRATAEYLNSARGVRCTAEQVVIVTSTQQALDLIARLLIDPHDEVWVEEPCYVGATAALRNAGARLMSVRVDDEGLDVEYGERMCPSARLAYVTPSHQFPLGVTMTLARRLALLRWAERARSWIIEDDYDSEFRYDGHPLAALQGLDESSRVLYVGTFNKVMYPALRLAYVVVPPDLAAVFGQARQWLDGHTSTVMQAVMADFMFAGHFVQHIRRMRSVYRERRDALCAAVERHSEGRIRLGPSDAGMHAVGWLPRGTDVTRLRQRAAARGLYLRDVAAYYAARPREPGLVLNFASAAPATLTRGVVSLCRLID